MRVGFIGLGNMGEGMAANLATKGFALTVRDVRPEPIARLVALGAKEARTNADIGAQSDVVCIAVFDGKQILDTVFACGEDAGVLAGMSKGGAIILHPTAPPSIIHRVADAARPFGVDVLDAPMTGGANIAAAAGTLTFMIGGEANVIERVRPVLEAMATSIFRVGPLGAGAAAKIINNFLAVSQTLIVREALRLASAVEITEEDILNIVNTGGVGSNWSSINWGKIKAQEAGYTTGPQGMVDMSSKDLRLAEALARETGAATPALDALVEKALPDVARTGLTDNGLS